MLPYAHIYLFGFLLVFLTQYLTLLIIDFTRHAIDTVALPEATKDTILPFIWQIAGTALLLVVVRTASRLFVFTPGRLIEFNIRNDYYSRLLHLQRDFLSKHQSGDLVSRCSNDIGYVRAAYGFGVLQIANVSITLILAVKAMINLDSRLTVFLVLPLLTAFLIIQYSLKKVMAFWRLSNQQLGQMSSVVLASYKGVAAIQNYHAEPAIEKRFEAQNDQYLATQDKVVVNRSFVMPLVMLVGDFTAFLIFLLGGLSVIDGSLTLGELTAFAGYVGMVMPPLLGLGWMINVFQQALPAMERLNEILQAESTLLPPQPAPRLVPGQPVMLEARNLSFSYQSPRGEGEEQPFRLDGVQFELPQGKVLGIVGSLGCGKTTLLDTLLRLNGPQPGALFLNDTDAAYISLEDFRRHISFAPQKAFLFSTTLRKNLLVSVPVAQADKVTDAELMNYLDYAGFDLDPKQFPHGLETEVGEKGVMLSGGQRQRIALARALMKESDIYVLDDVLSAVDHETEKRIIANLRVQRSGKSFIIASHRVSAVQWADEIIVLDQGRIVDRGTHQQLIERPGFYAEIYQYQNSHEEAA